MPSPASNGENSVAFEAGGQPERNEISIVIPTIGRELLKGCIRSIASGSTLPSRLIVVDQSSNAEVESWLETERSSGLKTLYVASRETGRAAGLNRGLERVATRFCAITDDDCLVEPDWLEKMLLALEAHPGFVISGRVIPEGNEEVLSTVTSDESVVYARPLLTRDPLFGGNMGIAMSDLERIGAFDESPTIRSAEDNDFGYRALCAGFPIRYVPEITVRHLGWRDRKAREARYVAYAKSQGGFYGKNLRRADWFICRRALRDLLRGPLRWGRGLWRRDREMAVSGRAFTRGLLPGILAGLRNRGL